MNKNKIIIGTAQSDVNYGIIKSKNFIHLSKFVKMNNFFIDTAPVYKNSDLFFNILNQTFLEKNLLKTLKNKKIEIHGRSIFLQGLLLLDHKKIPKNLINNKALIRFFKFIKNTKISPLEHCIKFVQNIKEIDKFVVGFNSLDQLKQFLKCLKNINQININRKIYDSLKSKDLKIIDPRKWNYYD